MEEMRIHNCKCGGTPLFRDRDDFELGTKTYIITCHSCGQSMSYERKIGEISPKKAITGLISEWNRQQAAAADKEA